MRFLSLTGSRRRPATAKRRLYPGRLRLELLEDRCLLSQFSLGTLVQVAPTDLFASAKPGNQSGVYFPDTQVEPRLAVDPTNPQHMVGAWQQERWDDGGSFGSLAAVTFDGGNTWSEGVIPGLTRASGGPYDRASDPWVSFGPTGTVYVCSLGLDGSEEAGITASAVLVNRSTDGGLTWSPPATLIQGVNQGVKANALDDKEAITADPHNPNLVYAVWDRPNINFPSSGTQAQTFFSRSTDGGVTWSAPQVIFQSPGVDTSVGHQIVVLPNGTLVDAFEEFHSDPSTSTVSHSLESLRSTDGGVTWSPQTAVAQMPQDVIDPFNRLLVRTGGSLPEVAVDPTSGNLYAVWEDFRFSTVGRSGYFVPEGIVFSLSTDGGSTWSSPIPINQTPQNSAAPLESQAFTPSIAVGGDGTVAVTYDDFRNQGSLAGAATDSWAVFGNPRGPGGLTNPANWGNELRLTSSSFNLLNAPIANGWFLGDYAGLVAAGNNFEALFSEAGSTFPQAHVFARQIVDPPQGLSAPEPLAPTTVSSAASPLARGQTPASLSPSLPANASSAPSGFLAPVSYPADKGADAMAVGDINKDGIPDLVVSNQLSNDVSVLLGNGDGTFQPAQNFQAGKTPHSVALGDFNGDGTLDIAVAGADGVTVLLGKPNGGFQNPVTIKLPSVIANQASQSPLAVAVGDVNHDGKLDIVVAAQVSVFGGVKGFVDVLLGQGNGTFTIGSVMPINSALSSLLSPVQIALADFGNGNLDLVTDNFVDQAGTPGDNRISVLLGNGDGTFRETNDPNVGVAVEVYLAVGDVNNDHKPDLMVDAYNGATNQDVVSVLLGNGDGTFQSPQVLVPGNSFGPLPLAVGDFNRDGNLDIVTVGGGTVNVLLGNGNGTFQPPLSFPFGATRPVAVAVGDFNQDGFPDVAIAYSFSNTVQVLINSGTWPAPATVAAVSTASSSLLPGTPTPAPADSASSQSNPSSAVLFGADLAAVDQLFGGLEAARRRALWLAAALPPVDGWADEALAVALRDLLEAR
jgi:hypothetical protein